MLIFHMLMNHKVRYSSPYSVMIILDYNYKYIIYNINEKYFV